MKRTLSLLLAALLIASLIPASAFAAQSKLQTSFFPAGKPAAPTMAPYLKYTYSENKADYIEMYYGRTDELLKLGEAYAKAEGDDNFDQLYDTEYGYSLSIQVDGRVDGGSWQYNSAWDEGNMDDGMPYYLAFYSESINCGDTDKMDHYELSWLTYLENDEAAGFMLPMLYSKNNDYGDPVYHFDMENHTLGVRYRYFIKYFDTAADEYVTLTSDWSPETSIGANGNQKEPEKVTKLEAPVLSQFKLVGEAGTDDYRVIYYMDVPESYSKGDLYYTVIDGFFEPYRMNAEVKVGNGDWKYVYTANESSIGNGYREAEIEDASVTENTAVQVRVRIHDNVLDLYSPWSNELGTAPVWSAASAWAEEYLVQAQQMDLIPECLVGADMKQMVTRKEFAAIAVKVYESLTGEPAPEAADNPFTDCDDAEILKAVKIGVTDGVAADKFAPDRNISREQCAAMMTRVYKAYVLDGWTLPTDADFDDEFNAMFTMPEPFADDASIAAYAKPSVYFMKAMGIIDGVGNNRFAPKADVNVSQSQTYGFATREAALKIGVEMAKKLVK